MSLLSKPVKWIMEVSTVVCHDSRRVLVTQADSCIEATVTTDDRWVSSYLMSLQRREGRCQTMTTLHSYTHNVSALNYHLTTQQQAAQLTHDIHSNQICHTEVTQMTNAESSPLQWCTLSQSSSFTAISQQPNLQNTKGKQQLNM